ncbi:hypothetical protein HDV05_003375 [Chytridiales sp. JEL 0842]|nr:hypothetical protein HDV05_003375 [Chytridiales sp. JEL 0842]
MEARLQAIRDQLAKQKEKRGMSESVWKGAHSKRGSLNSYATDVLTKKGGNSAGTVAKKKGFSGVGDQANALHKQVEQVVMGRLDRLRQLQEEPPRAKEIAANSNNVKTSNSVGTSEKTPSETDLSAGVTYIKPSAPAGPPPARIWRVPTSMGSSSPIPSQPTTPLPTSTETPITDSPTAALFSAPKPPPSVSTTTTTTTAPPPRPNRTLLPQNAAPTFPNLETGISTSTTDDSDTSFLSALQSWRSISSNNITTTTTNNNGRNSTSSETDSEAPHVPKAAELEQAKKNVGGTLLEGTYDETQSRRAFLDALEEWRNGGKKGEDEKKKEVEDGTCTTATFSVERSRPEALRAYAMEKMKKAAVRTEEEGLTYFERLLLHQYRQNPEPPAAEKEEKKELKVDEYEEESDEDLFYLSAVPLWKS